MASADGEASRKLDPCASCLTTADASVITGLRSTQTRALFDSGAVAGHVVKTGRISTRHFDAASVREWASGQTKHGVDHRPSVEPPEGGGSVGAGVDDAEASHLRLENARATTDVLLDALVKESAAAARAIAARHDTLVALVGIIRRLDHASPATLPVEVEESLRRLLAPDA